MDDPSGAKDDDGNALKVYKKTYAHTMRVNNIATPVELQFSCIGGAKALAAGAAAVLSAFIAM